MSSRCTTLMEMPSVVKARSTGLQRRADAEEKALRAVERLMEEGMSFTDAAAIPEDARRDQTECAASRHAEP